MNYTNDEQWYKAHSRYRHDVETNEEKNIINRQTYQLSQQKETIRNFSNLMISKIKENIENEFGRYVANIFRSKLSEAFSNVQLDLKDTIKLEFSRSDFLFISPEENQKVIIESYKRHFGKHAVFHIDTKLIPDKVTTYRIYLPELTVAFAKTE